MSVLASKRFTILISVETPDRAQGTEARLTARLLDRLAASDLTDVPLVWNIASTLIADTEDDSMRVRTSLQARLPGDIVCPSGLTGAPNVRLRLDELDAELAWATTNTWGSGITDTTGIEPRLIVPNTPDTVRRGALKIYGESSVPVGVLGRSADGVWLSLVPSGDGVPGHGFPVLEMNDECTTRATLARALGRRRRSAHGTDAPVILWCRVGDEASVDRVLGTIAASIDLTGRGWSIVTIDPDAGADARVPKVAPLTVQRADASIAEMRRRRGSRINTRRILEAVADRATLDTTTPASSRRNAAARAGTNGGTRDFIASMMGEASIPGETVTALFDSGRLCGLHAETRTPTHLHPAHHYLVRDGETVAAETDGCFSFESDFSRGLRAESSVAVDDAEPIRVMSEYSFVSDFDVLVISERVDFAPSPGAVLYSMCAPILTPTRCAVTGSYLDGSTYDYEPQWELREVTLHGDAFGVWDGESGYTLIAMNEHGQPVPWTVTLLAAPHPSIVLGGRFELSAGSSEFVSLLLMRGELDDELPARLIAGKTPPDIVREIVAGSTAERAMRESSPARRES